MILLLILTLIMFPYLVGTINAVLFHKGKDSHIERYLFGALIICVFLTITQMAGIKLGFNFKIFSCIYIAVFISVTIMGAGCLLLQIAGRALPRTVLYRGFLKERNVHWYIAITLIILQGIICIGIYNACYDYDASLETTRTILQTGTIYQYGAYTGRVASYAFPLSNKLMFLPVLYAWLSELFHIDAAVVIGILIPIVTFLCMYGVVILWSKKIYVNDLGKQSVLIILFTLLIWFGDYGIYTTSFNVLHEGYSGAAILFGVLIPFALYNIKNKHYVYSALTVLTIPGLIKYDTLFIVLKDFPKYYQEINTGGGYLILWALAIFALWKVRHKFCSDMLFILFAIAEGFSEVITWMQGTILKTKNCRKIYKAIPTVVCILLIMLSGTVHILPRATEVRTNMFGIDGDAYEALQMIAEDYEAKGQDDVPVILASEEANKWIRRMDTEMQPLVGYSRDGYYISWYSYEAYSEEALQARDAANMYPTYSLNELIEPFLNVECDYFLIKKGYVPVGEEDSLAAGLDSELIYTNKAYYVYACKVD